MLNNTHVQSAALDEVMAQYLPGRRGGPGEDTPIRLLKEVIGRPGCGSVNDMNSQGLGWRGHTYGTPQCASEQPRFNDSCLLRTNGPGLYSPSVSVIAEDFKTVQEPHMGQGRTNGVKANLSDAQCRMLDNLLLTIVTFERSEPKDPYKRAHRAYIYQEMVAQKLFKVDCGMNFRELVDLAVERGLIKVDVEKDELHLKW